MTRSGRDGVGGGRYLVEGLVPSPVCMCWGVVGGGRGRRRQRESFLGTAGRMEQSSLDGRLQDAEANCKMQNAERSWFVGSGLQGRKKGLSRHYGEAPGIDGSIFVVVVVVVAAMLLRERKEKVIPELEILAYSLARFWCAMQFHPRAWARSRFLLSHRLVELGIA